MYKKCYSKSLTINGGLSVFLLLLNACAVGENKVTQTSIIEKYIGQEIATPKNQRVVLVGGCFDILHFGHIEFLRKAKEAGDYLIVALEPDESISNYKRRTPTHNQKERADILASIRFVDQVILLPILKGFVDYNKLVVNIHPQIIAATADDPQIVNKQKQASAVGAAVKVVVPRIGNFSSTAIKSQQK